MEFVRYIGLPLFIQTIAQTSFELVLLILIFSMLVSMRQDAKHAFMRKITIPYTRETLIFYTAVFLYNLFDLFIVFFEGSISGIAHFVTHISVFCYYLTGEFLTVFFLQVVKIDIAEPLEDNSLRYAISAFQLLQIPLVILLIATPFTNILYSFDARNNYVRSAGYWIWFYVTLITFLFIGLVIVIRWKKTDGFLRKMFAVSVIAPVTAFILNYFVTGVDLNNIAVMIAALIVFMLYENYRILYTIDMSREFDDMQTKIMLSQIQPHFLHNTLTSIIYYADKDSAKTKTALVDFSKYLRKNLDSISKEGLVSFKEELEHTKKYLSLEKFRFEENLEVEYDIQDEFFSLPVLTLQPLVENAVRHGIRKSKSGKGKVIIQSKLTDTHHEVKVIDDGAGFDVSGIEDMDETHIGIRNVRKRLMLECGGQLVITSEEGYGTVCRILIPKETEVV